MEAELVTSGDPDRHSYLPALGRSAEYLHYPQYLNISSSSAARRPTRRPSGCCWGRVRTWGEPSPCRASGAPARSGWEQSSSGTTRFSSRGYADVDVMLYYCSESIWAAALRATLTRPGSTTATSSSPRASPTCSPTPTGAR